MKELFHTYSLKMFPAVFILPICLLLMPALSSAQTRKNDKGPSKKELLEQNRRLAEEIDSLMAQMEALNILILTQEEDEEEDVPEQDSLSRFDPFPLEGAYSQSKADSLMAIWAIQQRNTFFEPDTNDYNRPILNPDATDEQYMDRLAKMGAVMTIPYNDAVRTYIERYSVSWKKKMPELLSLCYYYMPIFEEALDRYNLPLELKVMPIIESMLNPTATSRAGARGLWQFMLPAAKSYGLRVDSYVDERLDPYKSSDAAARLLRDSYQMFGDWALAISAYNCGMGRVQRAIAEAGGKTDFWSVYPYLPNETRNYIPSFVGMLYTVHYHKELGIKPDVVVLPLGIETLDVKGKLHLGQVSSYLGIPIEELRLINPQYTRDLIPEDYSSYPLNLPHELAVRFAAEEKAVYAYQADVFLSPSVVRGAFIPENHSGNAVAYKVKSGDTLGKIASRHNCTVAQLKKWNGLRSDFLKIGQILYIY